MSLVIIYEGKRKVVKIPTPNTLVQVLLVEAAQHFGLDPASAVLKHKKATLDPSQPFRFCNLSNNAQIDLVVGNSTQSAKKQMSRIALAVDGSDNVTESFDSNITLGEMISALISDGKIPKDCMDRSPELIYLRANYSADTLNGTTLASLGLAGQSARLQLRFGSSALSVASSLQTSTSSGSAKEAGSPRFGETGSPTKQSIAAPTSDRPDSSVGAVVVSSTSTAMEVVETTSALPAHTPHPSVVTPGTGVINTIFTATPAPVLEHVPPVPPLLPSPTVCMQQLLAENFDAASVPAVVTLAKYLVNIILFPEEAKFRKISTENKAFVTKVLAAKGALQFLYSVGFAPHGASALVLVAHGRPVDNGPDAASYLSLAQLSTLNEGWTALQQAMAELEVPVEDRPCVADVRSLQAQREQRMAMLQQQQAAFDPFKSHIVRAAPQPVRQHDTVPTPIDSKGDNSSSSGGSGAAPATLTLSATERQLLELQRKRAELEGRPQDVQRLTEVLFPRADGSIANLSEFTDEGVSSSDAYNEDDSRSAPRSVLQKILKGGEDNTPLTTQAVRDLQKAQKERVYSRTLIRIKLPDRLCLQGYFHPRHTVADVYAWVYSCLSVSPQQAHTAETADPVASALQSFELYTSPPRTVLSPYAPASVDKRPTGCGLVERAPCDSAATLTDLKLVPAALIYLAWKVSPEGSAKEGATVSPGHYLLPELLASDAAGGKAGPSGASSGPGAVGSGGAAAYPTGRALVPSAEGGSGSESAKQQRDAEDLLGGRRIAPGKASMDPVGDSKKMSKPKWFK